MRSFNYGAAGSASMDPQVFMVQALKKCLLNNKNIEKMIGENNETGISKRAINSIKLLEEMDMTLNKVNENEKEKEIIQRISLVFGWLMNELEDIKENWEKDKEFYSKKINNTNPTLENLIDTFKALT